MIVIEGNILVKRKISKQDKIIAVLLVQNKKHSISFVARKNMLLGYFLPKNNKNTPN
jgi:hypothetical protein